MKGNRRVEFPPIPHNQTYPSILICRTRIQIALLHAYLPYLHTYNIAANQSAARDIIPLSGALPESS